MPFIGEQNIKLPCPDSVITKECKGTITINIFSSRGGRSHGDFYLDVDTEEKNEFVCDVCGRKFRYVAPTAKFPRMQFVPIK